MTKSQTMPTKQFWDNKGFGIRSADGFGEDGYINGSHMAKSEEIISHIEKIVEDTLIRLGSKKQINYSGNKIDVRFAKSNIKAINKDRKGTRKEIIEKVRNLFEL